MAPERPRGRPDVNLAQIRRRTHCGAVTVASRPKILLMDGAEFNVISL